ncbi:MAG: AAA family ATPase [Prevotellaceae bacterium]|nr:AAA family ATPase [Prevotellaceae bacterium]
MENNYFISDEQAPKENNGQLIEQSRAQQAASQNTADELKQATAEDTRQLADGLSDTDKAVNADFYEMQQKSQAETEPKLSYHGLNLDALIIHGYDDIPDPIPMLSEEDDSNPVLTRKDISLIVGPAKSRKTTFSLGLAAAMLGKGSLGMRAEAKSCKVLIADTEQNSSYVKVNRQKLYRRMGWDEGEDHPLLTVASLLETDGKKMDWSEFEKEEKLTPARKRQIMLKGLIETIKLDFVVLDGVVDLCDDFNNQSFSLSLVDFLKGLAEKHDCHIISCLHLNKDRKTPRGHLGAIYIQKMQCGFLVEYYDEKLSRVSPLADGCRLKPFKEFYIGVGDDGLPYKVDDATAMALKEKEGKRERATKLIKTVFANNQNTPLTRSSLAKAMVDVSNELSGNDNSMPVKIRTAESYVDEGLKNWGLLVKNGILYSLRGQDDADGVQQDLDFNEENEE